MVVLPLAVVPWRARHTPFFYWLNAFEAHIDETGGNAWAWLRGTAGSGERLRGDAQTSAGREPPHRQVRLRRVTVGRRWPVNPLARSAPVPCPQEGAHGGARPVRPTGRARRTATITAVTATAARRHTGGAELVPAVVDQSARDRPVPARVGRRGDLVPGKDRRRADRCRAVPRGRGVHHPVQPGAAHGAPGGHLGLRHAWLAGPAPRGAAAAELPGHRGELRITFVPAAPVPAPQSWSHRLLHVGVMAGGAAQPPLWGDTGLIRAATRLLHVNAVATAWMWPRCRGRGAAAQGPRLPC